MLAALAKRRVVALAVLGAATIIAAIAPRVGWRLPKYPESIIIVTGALLAVAIGVRLALAALERRARAARELAREEAGRAFGAELSWVDATHEAETPEVEALRHALARRHEQLATAPDTDHLVALQREALVEAVRRGWLAPERLVLMEAHLLALCARPPAATAAPERGLLAVATTVYAALLPLGAAQRLTTVAIGAAAGLLFVLLEALGDPQET